MTMIMVFIRDYSENKWFAMSLWYRLCQINDNKNILSKIVGEIIRRKLIEVGDSFY